MQEKFSEGYIRIILEGGITGHKIPPFNIIVRELIVPKNRNKIHAKWRLEQTSRNTYKKLGEELRKQIKVMKDEEG